MELGELYDDHAEIEEEIEALQKEIDEFEPDPDAFSDQFDDLLNETGEVTIGTLSYDTAQVLKAVDPIAYREGLLDYVDSLGEEGFEKIREAKEELEELQGQLEGIEEEIVELGGEV